MDVMAERRWDLILPYKKMPISLNDRFGWRKVHEIMDEVKTTTRAAAFDAGIPRMTKCEVTLVWIVPDMKVRDTENPVPTLKAACDGLKDEVLKGIHFKGIVPDDSPKFMAKNMPMIVYRKGIYQVGLIVEDIS